MKPPHIRNTYSGVLVIRRPKFTTNSSSDHKVLFWLTTANLASDHIAVASVVPAGHWQDACWSVTESWGNHRTLLSQKHLHCTCRRHFTAALPPWDRPWWLSPALVRAAGGQWPVAHHPFPTFVGHQYQFCNQHMFGRYS